MAAIGVDEEFAPVFTGTEPDRRDGAAPSFCFATVDRRVTCYYFYLWDEEFPTCGTRSSVRRSSRCAPTSRTHEDPVQRARVGGFDPVPRRRRPSQRRRGAVGVSARDNLRVASCATPGHETGQCAHLRQRFDGGVGRRLGQDAAAFGSVSVLLLTARVFSRQVQQERVSQARRVSARKERGPDPGLQGSDQPIHLVEVWLTDIGLARYEPRPAT